MAQTFGTLPNEELTGVNAAILHLNRIVDKLEMEAGFRKGRTLPSGAEGDG